MSAMVVGPLMKLANPTLPPLSWHGLDVVVVVGSLATPSFPDLGSSSAVTISDSVSSSSGSCQIKGISLVAFFAGFVCSVNIFLGMIAELWQSWDLRLKFRKGLAGCLSVEMNKKSCDELEETLIAHQNGQNTITWNSNCFTQVNNSNRKEEWANGWSRRGINYSHNRYNGPLWCLYR